MRSPREPNEEANILPGPERDTMFIFCSVHSNPFPEATSPLSRIGRYVLASVLFITELTLLMGVPATTGFLAWSTRNQLWPALNDAGLRKEAEEVLGYLVFDTIFLGLLIWGAVPVLAASRMGGNRGRVLTYAAFGGMTVVFVGVSIRTMYLTWNWAVLFELATGDASLAGRCKFISLTLGVLLCLGCASAVIYSLYTAKLGTPSVIRQMLDDAAHLLCPDKMRVRRVADGDDEESMSKSAGVQLSRSP
ncbi:hypothetical protein FPOA_12216 [Fusarium poae]|uniref:Uncharacterized protein n=1 Tax=Fusarium poae TaxID=36050 RepID=A0A1B8A9Z2_FUSPO|nr:hypothetical protein FPOA_12220 [Fusarium poae]OBS17281.1 hypothetical protein FPOA_12216 [Fusarium poae]